MSLDALALPKAMLLIASQRPATLDDLFTPSDSLADDSLLSVAVSAMDTWYGLGVPPTPEVRKFGDLVGSWLGTQSKWLGVSPDIGN